MVPPRAAPVRSRRNRPPGPGERIRARRILLGLTQETVAAEVGVQQEYISALERGTRTAPSADVRRRLAKVLQTTPADLWPDSETAA